MDLLITGAWTDAKKHIAEIEAMGHRVRFLQQEKDELPCTYEWVEGVICNGLFLHHPISRFTNLRYIQLTSAGYDRVPMDEVERRHIEIHNARGVYSIPMAEFAIAGVLDLYKDMARFREQQKIHEWAFDCRVIGIDIYVRDDCNYDAIKELQELQTEVKDADVMVLTLPLTEDTRGLIDREILSSFKGILVNIARGGIVDQKALEEWNGSAVLDVFEQEPLEESSPLWEREKMIITPHNSFIGNRNGLRLKNLIIHNLERLMRQ